MQSVVNTASCVDLKTQKSFLLARLRQDPTNGRRKKTDFWYFRRFSCLIRAAKTPQTRHFVRFCGVFAAAQNFDTKGAAKGQNFDFAAPFAAPFMA